MLLPIGCAKSQQPHDDGYLGNEIAVVEADFGMDFYDGQPDTTRVTFGNFELIELSDQLQDELWGHFEGKSVQIIPRSAGRLLEIVAQEDLDGDGWEDLLIGELAEQKCCPRQFSVVTYRGHGQYHESAPQGAALHLPTMLAAAGKWKISIENRDLDDYQSYATHELLVLDAGELKRVEVQQSKDVAALAELRVSAYDTLDPQANVVLDFDLDADGKRDLITGSLWATYGRVHWSLAFGNGKVMADGTPFQRLGVLPTKTEGVHDLVVDRDRVLVWNGKRYEDKED